MFNKNKKVWITGASQGIGEALAKKFSKEGWIVAASARNKNTLSKLAIDKNIFSFPLDVTDYNQVFNSFQLIKDKFENIDLCIFCAGSYKNNYDNKFDLKQSRKLMEVNFFGTLNCINAVEKFLKEKKEGHVAIVSSVFSYRGLPDLNDYCASKAALSTFAESLYFEFKKYNLKVSLINPAFVKTNMSTNSKFKLPFIKHVTPEYAANKIFRGLIEGNSFEIHFPKFFSLMMKVLKFMPNWLFFFIGGFIKKRVKIRQ